MLCSTKKNSQKYSKTTWNICFKIYIFIAPRKSQKALLSRGWNSLPGSCLDLDIRTRLLYRQIKYSWLFVLYTGYLLISLHLTFKIFVYLTQLLCLFSDSYFSSKLLNVHVSLTFIRKVNFGSKDSLLGVWRRKTHV